MHENNIRQMNLERVKNYGNALYIVANERYKILPLISTVSAALIGLLIQGNILIKHRELAFIALIILLLLIPISIFVNLFQLDQTNVYLQKKLKNIGKIDQNTPKLNSLPYWFPYFLLIIFWSSIILVILSLLSWNHIWLWWVGLISLFIPCCLLLRWIYCCNFCKKQSEE